MASLEVEEAPLLPQNVHLSSSSNGRKVFPFGTKALAVLGTALVFLFLGGLGWVNNEQKYVPIAKREIKLDATGSAASQGTSMPHIVFFLIDDQGFDDMGYQTSSNTYMPTFTPSLDAAAEAGIKFQYYYSDHLCSPSRASILTGKSLIHNGFSHQVASETTPMGLPLEHKLLPQFLKDQGYLTHMVGKWHLGMFNHKYLPTERGFDSFMGYYSGKVHYYGKYVLEKTTKIYDFHMNEAPYADTETYTLQLFDERASEIITAYSDSDTDQPMFLYYATQGIHDTFYAPPGSLTTSDQRKLAREVLADSGSRDRELLTLTAAAMDKTFSNLINYLKDAGMYDNTIIIVASDNGGCSEATGSNYPLRGQKNSLFEGGVRTNAFVHSPLLNQSVVNTTYDCMFHNVDWMPTIYGMLGLDESALGPIDGVNHWDQINSGGEQCYRSEMLHNIEVDWKTDGIDTLRVGLRNGDYKLVYGEREGGWFGPNDFSEIGCDTTPKKFPPFGYFFDIANDPTESHNLIDEVDDALLWKFWSILDAKFDEMASPAWRYTVMKGLDTWIQNDFWLRPWISDEDLKDLEDEFQREMQENSTVSIDGGHDHTSHERSDDAWNEDNPCTDFIDVGCITQLSYDF